LVVPQTAILRDENGSSVFIVSSDGGRTRAARRAVTLGPSYGGRTVITSGLAAGDFVIIVGQTNVTEGDAVDIASSRTEG
jgi:membrane fusion protein (multidrug efflux system)